MSEKMLTLSLGNRYEKRSLLSLEMLRHVDEVARDGKTRTIGYATPKGTVILEMTWHEHKSVMPPPEPKVKDYIDEDVFARECSFCNGADDKPWCITHQSTECILKVRG